MIQNHEQKLHPDAPFTVYYVPPLSTGDEPVAEIEEIVVAQPRWTKSGELSSMSKMDVGGKLKRIPYPSVLREPPPEGCQYYSRSGFFCRTLEEAQEYRQKQVDNQLRWEERLRDFRAQVKATSEQHREEMRGYAKSSGLEAALQAFPLPDGTPRIGYLETQGFCVALTPKEFAWIVLEAPELRQKMAGFYAADETEDGEETGPMFFFMYPRENGVRTYGMFFHEIKNQAVNSAASTAALVREIHEFLKTRNTP